MIGGLLLATTYWVLGSRTLVSEAGSLKAQAGSLKAQRWFLHDRATEILSSPAEISNQWLRDFFPGVPGGKAAGRGAECIV
jgi:hypothetical protein